MFLENLGIRIRDARTKKKLTQNDLANALQVSPQAVSKWERGENAPDIALIPQLANLLGVSADRLLGTYTQSNQVFDATVCFSDIPFFTKRAEGLAPEDVATIINAHYYQITELVLRDGGIPVKYIGDAFLCFFAGPEHQLRAVRTWIRAKKVLTERIGAGLCSGPIFLGRLGHPEYANMDIMGETVNIAARVESWSGKTDSRIAATYSVIESIRGLVKTGTEEETEVKGISKKLHFFEICGLEE